MAELLKRWNGSSWIPVTTVNRIVVNSGGGLISQPSYTTKFPPPNLPTNYLLTPNSFVSNRFSYGVTI